MMKQTLLEGNMNKKDLKIIARLRENGREPLTTMSKKIKIPVSTIFDRLRLQEKNGVIRPTALINFNKLGLEVRASLFLKVDKNDKNNLREYLIKNNQVNSVYSLGNGFDFLVEAVFYKLKDLEKFLEGVEDKFDIMDKEVYYLVEELKKEGFLSSLWAVETIF